MKLVNYALQKQMELLREDKSNDFFKHYIQSIIENTNKPYHQRADYVGLSLHELKSKIDYLSQDIKELQAFKKLLAESLEIAKELTADVFISNGIDRMDGSIISSLTLSKESSKTTTSLTIIDAEAVMRLGYIKYEPDAQAIEVAMQTKEGLKELKKYVIIESTLVETPSKIKVNTKRSSANITIQTDEILELQLTQAA